MRKSLMITKVNIKIDILIMLLMCKWMALIATNNDAMAMIAKVSCFECVIWLKGDMSAHAVSPINGKARQYPTLLLYFYSTNQTQPDFCILYRYFVVLGHILAEECCIAGLDFYHIGCFYTGGSKEALIVNSSPIGSSL